MPGSVGRAVDRPLAHPCSDSVALILASYFATARPATWRVVVSYSAKLRSLRTVILGITNEIVLPRRLTPMSPETDALLGTVQGGIRRVTTPWIGLQVELAAAPRENRRQMLRIRMEGVGVGQLLG